MCFVQGHGGCAAKVDHRVRQAPLGLFVSRPPSISSWLDDRPANEPSAEELGCRGWARCKEVRHRISSPDEGSAHFEWHWRFGNGPRAIGSRQDRVDGELSSAHQEVRPDRNFSGLRDLTQVIIRSAAHPFWNIAPLVSRLPFSDVGRRTAGERDEPRGPSLDRFFRCARGGFQSQEEDFRQHCCLPGCSHNLWSRTVARWFKPSRLPQDHIGLRALRTESIDAGS